VLLHFEKDHATPLRTDTLVSVITFISTNNRPVRDIALQMAVPKVRMLIA